MKKVIKSKSSKSTEAPAKGKSSAASAKSEATSQVVANPRLVAAMKTFEQSKLQTQSYLVAVGEIIQNEQLTKAEVVASIMEARGIEKVSAESQFSRFKKIFTDPDTLEALRSGEIDLKTAKEGTSKKQSNPSAKKQAENREKRFAKATTQIVQCAKEGGMDMATVLNSIKAALKKGGVK